MPSTEHLRVDYATMVRIMQGTKMIGSIVHHALSPVRRINAIIPVVKIPTPKPPPIQMQGPEQEIRNELPMPIGTIKNGKA